MLLYTFYIESEIPICFYYDLGASTALLYIYCALAVSATIRVILTKISNRSGIAVQWNKGLRRLLLGVFGCFLLFNYVSSLLCNTRGVFKKYADRCCHSPSF